jgi:hypothetical protein
VRARFGPIGQEGGEKRLNVAITRARQGVWLVTSMSAASLDVGLGSQLLDLAIRIPGEASFTVGVDCTRFLSHWDSLSRDVYGRTFWERAGWKVLRVSPGMWLHRRDETLDMVARAVSTMGPDTGRPGQADMLQGEGSVEG